MRRRRHSENGTSFAKIVRPAAPAQPQPIVRTVEVGPIFHNGEAHAKVHAWMNARPEYAGWRWEGEWYVRLRPPGSNRDALHRRAVKVVRERHEFRQAPRAHCKCKPRVGRRRRGPDLQQRRGGDEGVGVARRPSRICGLDVLRRMVPLPLHSTRAPGADVAGASTAQSQT